VRDADAEPFWRGCDEQRLCIQRCRECESRRWPPGPACPACGSGATEWARSSGRGRVYSWVVVRFAAVEALADQLPYAVGLIELEEGVRIVCTIEGCELDEISAGMRVAARFDDAGDGRRMLTFVPDLEEAA
jgi:uncharacterized protein